MRYCVLSSGSKANATFIECGETRILIDCGLSARQVTYRLGSIGVDPGTLTAILVTHEHSDHVFGIENFTKRLKTVVFMNEGTREGYRQLTKGAKLKREETFSTNHQFEFSGVKVTPFSISHDASDPVGFRLEHCGQVFVYCTDLGRVTPRVSEGLQGAHGLVLESNHDEDLLRACHYPWELKERILSNQGHLSNHSAGNLLQSIVHSELRHITLGHLSEHSNRPEVALQTVRSYLRPEHQQRVLCAGIAAPTPIFDFDAPQENTTGPEGAVPDEAAAHSNRVIAVGY